MIFSYFNWKGEAHTYSRFVTCKVKYFKTFLYDCAVQRFDLLWLWNTEQQFNYFLRPSPGRALLMPLVQEGFNPRNGKVVSYSWRCLCVVALDAPTPQPHFSPCEGLPGCWEFIQLYLTVFLRLRSSLLLVHQQHRLLSHYADHNYIVYCPKLICTII